MRPRSARNAAASAASSWAISSSILAQTAAAAVPARARNGPSPARSAALASRAAPCPSPVRLRFVDVDDDEQRLGGQELKAAQPLEIVALEVERAQRLAVLERRLDGRDDVALAFELGRPRFLQILDEALQPAFGDAEVREDQLVFHRLRVARRIDRPGRVRHRGIVERADHVDERVGVLVGGDVDQRLGHRRCRPSPRDP